MNFIFRFIATPLLGIVVLAGVVACEDQSPTANKSTQNTNSEQVQNIESNLTFNDVTLEQADEQGQSV